MGLPVPGWDVAILDEDEQPLPAGRARRDLPEGALEPALPARLLEPSRGHGGGLRRRLVPHQGRGPDRRGRLLLVRRPRRRRDHLRRLPDRPVRGRVGLRRAPRGAGGGGRRVARPKRGDIVKAFIVLAEGREPPTRPPTRSSSFVRERHSALRLPARDRVRGRPAEDADRQDPARRAARGRARAQGRRGAAPRLGSRRSLGKEARPMYNLIVLVAMDRRPRHADRTLWRRLRRPYEHGTGAPGERYEPIPEARLKQERGRPAPPVMLNPAGGRLGCPAARRSAGSEGGRVRTRARGPRPTSSTRR